MTKTYVPTDMWSSSFNVSREHGGCGKPHTVSDDGIVECDQCASFLMKYSGASPDKRNVARTPDEEADLKHLSIEGEKRAQEVANAFARIVGNELAQEAPPSPRAKPKPSKSVAEGP